jgi:hypothetical protein
MPKDSPLMTGPSTMERFPHGPCLTGQLSFLWDLWDKPSRERKRFIYWLITGQAFANNLWCSLWDHHSYYKNHVSENEVYKYWKSINNQQKPNGIRMHFLILHTFLCLRTHCLWNKIVNVGAGQLATPKWVPCRPLASYYTSMSLSDYLSWNLWSSH